MKNLTLVTLAFLAVASSPVSALAANQSASDSSVLAGSANSSVYLGALIGANVPSGDFNSDKTANYGLTVGGKLNPFFGVGVFGSYYGQKNSGSVFGLPTGTASSTYNVAGEANFFFSVFHAGADLGASFVSWSANAGNASIGNSKNSMIYGPEAGFDIPLGTTASHVSIGGEAHYLFTNASQGQDNLQALAALKFWM